jgi:CRISPR system Cascade subunit CasB
MTSTKPDYGARAREWWTALGTGERAALRRCHAPIDALMLSSTYDLMRRLGWRGERSERFAALACVLAHVSEDDPRRVARAIGRAKFGSEDALVSEARFRRLLTVDDPADLQTALARIIVHMGNRASVGDLTTSMLFWNDRTRADWAAHYYAASIPEISTEMVNVDV